MRVIGIDPSFTGCGISDGTRYAIIKTKPGVIIKRCREIEIEMQRFIGAEKVDIIVVEAPAFSPNRAKFGITNLFERGYLYRGIDQLADMLGARVISVEPTVLKKFVCGKGNAGKIEVPLAVYKRWGIEFGHDPGGDMAHAFALVKYGESIASEAA